MNAKEKAENLVNNHYELLTVLIPVNDGYERAKRHDKLFPIAKQCALIAVDEILKNQENVVWKINKLLSAFRIDKKLELSEKYWQQVKTEIEKL